MALQWAIKIVQELHCTCSFHAVRASHTVFVCVWLVPNPICTLERKIPKTQRKESTILIFLMNWR